MTFEQAERLFQQLEARYQAGQVTLDQYRVELARLCVTDERGERWQMQERTGQWHVFRQGRWQPASPPHRLVPPSAAAGPPAWAQQQAPAAPAAAPTSAPVPTDQRRKRLLWIGGGLIALLLICGGAVCLGVGLLPNLPSWTQKGAALPSGQIPVPNTPEVGQKGVVTYEQTGVTSAPAGGEAQDQHGAALLVPPDAFTDGESALLIAGQIEGPLVTALEQGYTVDTPFYTVSADGEKGGRGRAHLSLPAPSPSSRMLALIDGAYPAVLGVQPQNGELSVNVRLAPREGSTEGANPDRAPTRYAVITPKTTSRLAPGLAAPTAQTTFEDCSWADSDWFNGCRTDAAHTVYVVYPRSFGDKKAEQLVSELLSIAKTYRALGFAAATLSSSTTMTAEILPSGEDFEYSSKTGTIYAPGKSVDPKPGTQGYYAVRHEIAHWIQDEEYAMTWAMGTSQAHKWWLEIAAEMMVMLADPTYIDALLDDQGDLPVKADNDHTLTIQLSPHGWPDDVYIHAHQVMFSMCDDATICPLSQSELIEAINRAKYPFDQTAAQQKLRANLKSYALYLAGGKPGVGNARMPSTGHTATGDGYGNQIATDATKAGAYRMFTDGAVPNVTVQKRDGMDHAVLRAEMQSGGVYPLLVLGQHALTRPSLPLSLTVRSEAPFWYRRGSDDPVFADGQEGLVLAPIHKAMGLESVRVVAYADAGPLVLSGEVGVVDLSGAVVFEAGNLRSHQIACRGDTGSANAGDAREFADELANIAAQLTAAAAGTGDFKGSTPASLTWQMVPERLPPSASPELYQFKGTMDLKPDHVLVKTEFVLLETPPTSQGTWPDALPLLGIAIAPLPAAWLGRKRKRWRPALVVLFAGLLLSACLTDLRVSGTIDSEMRFRKIEYLGGSEVPTLTTQGQRGEATPRWRLSEGSGSFDVNFVIVGTKEDEKGNKTEERIICAGPVEYDVSAEIYDDIVTDYKVGTAE